MTRPRTTPQSPRRVNANSNIYMSPMKSRAPLVVASSPMEYNFKRSPARNLRDINHMLRRHTLSIRSKRYFAFNDADAGDVKRPRPALPRQLELIKAGGNSTET